jgi:hypothetical protein
VKLSRLMNVIEFLVRELCTQAPYPSCKPAVWSHWGLYNRPEVAAVPGLSPTPPIIKKKRIVIMVSFLLFSLFACPLEKPRENGLLV